MPVRLEAPVPLGLAAPYTFTLWPDPLLIFGDPNMADNDSEGVHFKLLARCNKRIAEPVQLAASYGAKPKRVGKRPRAIEKPKSK